MLYYLHLLRDFWSPFWVFKYITVRALAGAGTAFLLSVILGPWMIQWLRRLNMGQYVRTDEAPPLYALHGHKQGTPTMGGLMIIGTLAISVLLWTIPGNIYVLFAMTTTIYMGLVGFWDDYTKKTKKQSKGLSARAKMSLILLWVIVVTALLLYIPDTSERVRQLMVPFVKEPAIRHMAWWGVFLFLFFVIAGATNAVNLTDGLDGLAIGCSSSVAITYLVLSYVAGNAKLADYLFVPYIPGTGELAVFCGCLAGSCLGFLWYNCHPAKVFMGDTGSLALGGAIAMVAVLIKQELLLVIVGGVFVMEAMSVIIQVISFKTRGKRVFAMAPIHHHFEMKKWSETQVTIRFWIISIILALVGILSLKIR